MTTATAGTVLYDDLATVYDRWLSGDDAAEDCLHFYLTELRGETAPVLELGCGTGRICHALSAAGVDMTGVDASAEMLAMAGTGAAAAGTGPTLVQARFEALPFADATFAAVILPMRTVGHLTDRAALAAAFAEVHRVLRPHGRFVLDHYQLDVAWARAHDGTFRLMYSGAAPDAEDRAVLIWDRYDYDFAGRSLTCTVGIDRVGPGGDTPTSTHVRFPFRWFDVDELVGHGHDAGLRLDRCWGDFHGGPFTGDSEHMVLRFERPGERR
jgi:SAM-dependent methyltransferase